jgi:hypothetical protein
MDQLSFRSRIVHLLQRSRKAVQLYSSVGQASKRGSMRELSELQAEEWRATNEDLVSALVKIATINVPRIAAFNLAKLCERLVAEVALMIRSNEEKQDALILAAQNGDFVQAAITAAKLVSGKAYVQSKEAALAETSGIFHGRDWAKLLTNENDELQALRHSR